MMDATYNSLRVADFQHLEGCTPTPRGAPRGTPPQTRMVTAFLCLWGNGGICKYIKKSAVDGVPLITELLLNQLNEE